MTRRLFLTLGGVALFVALALPAVAAADEAKPGEIWVTLKGNDYAKPFLDGQEYEDHEFEKNGLKLVIRVDDIAVPYTFEVRPSNSALRTITVETETAAFKATRIRGKRARRMVMKFTANFTAKPVEKKK